MWPSLAELVLLGYVPGAVLYRLPWGDRARRAVLPFEERAFWAVVLSVALSLFVTLALAYLDSYSFPGLLVCAAVLTLAAAAAAGGRLRYEVRAPRPGIRAVVPVAIVVAGLWLYFPPSEYVMGGKDPGTYMNEGIQIAQRGSLVVRDPVVEAVPAGLTTLFYPSHHASEYYGVRFMGFFVMDPRAGTVLGQFPHLYPASIAIGYGLNGLSGARQAVGAWAILGLVAVYLVGARLLGAIAAAGATALVAVNVIVVWFARYPNAEVVMLALVFAALLALARALVDGDRFFGPVAGTLTALLLFLRFDSVLFVGAIAAALILARYAWLRVGVGFFVTAVPLGLLALGYLFGLMRPYVALPIIFTTSVGPWLIGGVGVALMAVALALARIESLRNVVRRWVPWALAGALTLLAAYAYWFREPAGKLALHDAIAFRTFAWYVTPLGLAAAVLGLLVLAPRLFWRDPAFFATLATFSVFFFYKIRIVPDHFWMTRRFLPVILPGAMLLVSGLATFVASWLLSVKNLAFGGTVPTPDGAPLPDEALKSRGIPRKSPTLHDGQPTTSGTVPVRRLAGGVVGLVPVALLGWQFWIASQPVLHHVEYAGLIPRLESLMQRFGDNDLVIVESRNSSDLHVLAPPLAYIYAKPVLVLASPRPDRALFETFLTWARGRFANVYFLGGGGTDLLSSKVAVEPIASDRFQIPEYDAPVNAYPSGVRQKEFDFGLYRFVEPSAAGGPFSLTLGSLDDLHVVRFHAKERDPATGHTWRWTRDTSYVTLTGATPAWRELRIRMSDGHRPAIAGRAVVSVFVDDRPLGSVTVAPDPDDYAFAIPSELAATFGARVDPPRLKLTTSVWIPRKVLGTPDDRDLGVRVDRVDVR